MVTAHQRLSCCIVATLALLPCAAQAQTPAHSFEELQHSVRIGQHVVVTADNGRKTTGTVRDVSPSSITVGTSVFPESAVRELRRADRLWNGALIGAAIGTGLATWDYAVDPSEPGNAVIFTVAIGLGSAIGAAIDGFAKGKVLYRSPLQKVAVAVVPLVGKGKRGALVAVRF
jgi:hypothetical protein